MRNKLDCWLDRFGTLQRQYGRHQHIVDSAVTESTRNYHKDKLAAVKRKLKKCRQQIQEFVAGERAAAYYKGEATERRFPRGEGS